MTPVQAARPEARPDRYAPERLAATPAPAVGRPTPQQAPPRPEQSPAARSAPPLTPDHPSAPVPGSASPAAPSRSPLRPTPPPVARPAAGSGASAPPPVPARAAGQSRSASAALAAGLRPGVLPGQPGTHPSAPLYGDWTRPSRSGAEGQAGARVPAAPLTEAIPEREVGRGRQGSTVADDDLDDHGYDDYDEAYDDVVDDADDHGYDDYGEPLSARSDDLGPSTDSGPSTQVRGGRAADRAARQAFDVERRRELKRQGENMTARAYLDDEDPDARRPRKLLLALVAVAVVALGVLGVYSFISPATQPASKGSAAGTSTPAVPGDVADATLPELSVSPPPVVAAVDPSVKAPVIVMNATDVNGLAGRVASTLQAGGWETPATATYTGGDVAATTVYYTDGDQTQQAAAHHLVSQFPDIKSAAVRFFEVPEQPNPGLVVVLAGDWQP